MVGNLPNFMRIDVLRCLLKIEKPISRLKLSEILELGEGTIRSILDILKENNLLNSNKQGHYLSEKGYILINKIKNNIKIEKVELKNISPDKKKIAIHIKKPKNLQKAYELRDTALKSGADGALILEYDKSLKFYEEEIDKSYDFGEMENKFDLNKDDLVIVAYADSYKLAEDGALAVAVELSNSLKNIIQELK